jgi:large subunit ribosomal protein L31
MKADIHPQFIEARFVCSCGNTFTSRSTKPDVHVEVCYKCHPFYTGEHRFIDTKGRVENFQKAQQVAKERQKLAPKKDRRGRRGEDEPKTLRELLSEM